MRITRIKTNVGEGENLIVIKVRACDCVADDLVMNITGVLSDARKFQADKKPVRRPCGCQQTD
jgi:hypothetical protein